MPKFEAKQIQKDLDQGLIWPVYYLFGEERMKARELLKRIKKAAFGEAEIGPGFGAETLEGSDTDAASVVDAAFSFTLGGGMRFIIVRDAHLLKNPDGLLQLLEAAHSENKIQAVKSPPFVCVFLARDLDARRKISKKIVELAAVISCEAIADQEREGWIGYLAGRRGLKLDAQAISALRCLDPWSLDGVDSELEKIELLGSSVGVHTQEQGMSTDEWIDAFFQRRFEASRVELARFADRPDEALPRLGLLAWNLRQLVAYRASGGRLKMNPYLASKIDRWARLWTSAQLAELGDWLSEIYFGMKQTSTQGLALWTDVYLRLFSAVRENVGQ